MKIRFEAEVFEGVQIRVKLPDDIKEYAEAWLVICNNHRENKNVILKVENDSGSSVYVTCKKKDEGDVKDWLESFGEIKGVEKVYICQPEYVWEKHTNDKLNQLLDGDEEYFELVEIVGENFD